MKQNRVTKCFGVFEQCLKLRPSEKLRRSFLACSLLAVVFNASSLLAQRAPVNVGSAGNFVVLSKTGITNVPPSRIVGNIGSSPITGAAIGVTCAEVIGTISAVDATGPAPCSLIAPVALTQAILDMQTAYTDAAGRTLPDFTELGAGNISGKTLAPGLYKWSTGVLVDSSGVTIQGSPNDVWIFQIAGDLNIASGAKIILSGGAQAGNIFWQTGGPSGAILGTTSAVSGVILSAKQVVLNTGATLNGRAFAQTLVTLQSNTITGTGTLVGGVLPILLNCSLGLTPSIFAGGIVNAASGTRTVAAGSIASIYGDNFGTSFSATTYPLLQSLGSTSIQAGPRNAPMFMTSCGQANIQIPWEAQGQAQLAVTATVFGFISSQQSVNVAAFAPGIFTMNQSGSGQGAVVIASTGELVAPVAPGKRPVARGEYIAIFGTGLGAVSNQPASGAAAAAVPLSSTVTSPSVTIGGVDSLVTFSGLAPGFAGLYQVNVLVPAGVPSGSSVNVVLTIGGVPSNTVTIAVQ